MTDPLHVVCPHCDAVNRIQHDNLAKSPTCGKCHQALFEAHPLPLTEARFDRHLTRSDLPLLVDFWAPWCGPCRMMAPAFEQAAAQLEPYMRLVKVDTQAEPNLGNRYQIRSIPTLALFKGGQEVTRQPGAMGLGDIVRWAQAAAGQ